jgi:hypothetical protein
MMMYDKVYDLGAVLADHASSRTGLRPAEMEIEKWRAETGARNPPRTDRNTENRRPETGASQPNPRE